MSKAEKAVSTMNVDGLHAWLINNGWTFSESKALNDITGDGDRKNTLVLEKRCSYETPVGKETATFYFVIAWEAVFVMRSLRVKNGCMVYPKVKRNIYVGDLRVTDDGSLVVETVTRKALLSAERIPVGE